MALAWLRRVLPGGFLLASLAWLACSPDSDITGPTSVGGPSFAEAVGEPVIWEPQPGITVTMQFLGELISGGWSQAWGIDDDNDVIVGQALTAPPVFTAAFYWTAAEGMKIIDPLGWSTTKAYDVRDNIIVGSGSLDGNQAAFRRVGSQMQALSLDDDEAIAEVVYEDGTALGQRKDGGLWEAVEWVPNFTDDHADFGDGINIRDANEVGDVVGAVFSKRAFLWRDYPLNHHVDVNEIEIEELPLTPDGLASSKGQSEGVNEHTQVVGYMHDPSHHRAFIWDPVNRTSELSGLGDNYHTKAFDINDSELVVGESGPPVGDMHAIAWINRQPLDLHPPEAGATASTAQAVNNNGLIAGFIWIAGSPRAVVWTIEGGGGGGEDEPLTPEEQLALLKDEIANLAEAGALSGYQAWSMTRKVNTALRRIERGWTRAAIISLRALVVQIEYLVRRGRLTSEQAAPLLELARGAIDGLRGG